MSGSLFAPIEKALVKFQSMLSQASMIQQDQVEITAKKTGSVYDKIWWNTVNSAVSRAAVKVVGFTLGAVAIVNKNDFLKHGAEGISGVADVVVSPFFDARRIDHERAKDLLTTQTQSAQSVRSSMANIEQYANTLEQRVDSQKQSARQIS